MEFNDSIEQDTENSCVKCNSSFWADFQLMSEKHTFYQNTLKSQIRHIIFCLLEKSTYSYNHICL